MCMRLKDLIQQSKPFNHRSNAIDLTRKISDLQLAAVKGSAYLDAQAYGAAHYSEQTAQIEYYCRLLWLAVPAKKIMPRAKSATGAKNYRGNQPSVP